MSTPLLEGIGVDEETQQAIEDWHYWVNRGYEF
ncbi:MAG TPA: calcium-binding protein [Ktedonobacteraceae bacterium]